MDHLNALDYIILAFLLWGFISGFRRGLIMELCTLAGLFLGIWLAIHFSKTTEEWMRTSQGMEGDWIKMGAFLMVFIAAYIAFFFLGKALSKAVSLMMLGIINRITGGLFGMIKMLMFSSLLLLMIKMAGLPLLSDKTEQESAIFQPVHSFAELVYPKIKDILPEKEEHPVKEALQP
jgi:membrane protein required for colicin V production